MKPTRLGWLTLLTWTLPVVSLLGFGFVWLWQQGGLLWWIGISGGLVGAGLLNLRRLRDANLVHKPEVQPAPYWLDPDLAVWEEVENLATELRVEEYPLDAQVHHHMLDLGQQVIERVARHYYPDSKAPLLEITLPHLLRCLELVNRDLRRLVYRIPGSHLFSLGQLYGLRSLGLLAEQAVETYRVGSMFFNPLGAGLREMRDHLQGRLLHYPKQELHRWLLQNYVRQVARYAIDLYSGKLTLDDLPLAQKPGPPPLDSPPQEPLRILLIGQRNAGKSSLINALFGQLKAATDALPLTAQVTPYVLQRDGLESAVVLDTPGYAEAEDGAPLRGLVEEILGCDLVFLVCAANSAARRADAQALKQILALQQAHPQRAPAPVLAILSHIDLLRPVREWEPPYNIADPQRPKAQQIRQAMQALAAELDLPEGAVLPVCLHAERIYNVEEGLVPAVLAVLPAAQRARYIRSLRARHDAEYWRYLSEQAQASGQILLNAASWARGKLAGS